MRTTTGFHKEYAANKRATKQHVPVGKGDKGKGETSKARLTDLKRPGHVQGGREEGARKVQGGSLCTLGCSLETFWVCEGYFESTLFRFLKLIIFPTEFNAFTYFPDRFSCFYTTMGLTWVHFGVTLG